MMPHTPLPITHPHFRAPHAFFTRHGGVSTGMYQGLNCNLHSSDELADILENRKRVAAYFTKTPEYLCTLQQIHSTMVVPLTEPPQAGAQGDAMVTNTPGLILGILTADCCPVLFYDSTHHVIGAAHAGWKGALGGIIMETLRAMVALGAKMNCISVAIGPTIGPASYEVDTLFYQRFLEQHADNGMFFIPGKRSGHYYFNLPAYIHHQLKPLGLASLYVLPYDTCAEPDLFFSYRYSVLSGETRYGCQLSAICL